MPDEDWFELMEIPESMLNERDGQPRRRSASPIRQPTVERHKRTYHQENLNITESQQEQRKRVIEDSIVDLQRRLADVEQRHEMIIGRPYRGTHDWFYTRQKEAIEAKIGKEKNALYALTVPPQPTPGDRPSTQNYPRKRKYMRTELPPLLRSIHALHARLQTLEEEVSKTNHLTCIPAAW